jgi:hypothetical protein
LIVIASEAKRSRSRARRYCRVTLRGSVPPDELDDVLDEVAAVNGVREVYNLLQVQLAAPYIPGHN